MNYQPVIILQNGKCLRYHGTRDFGDARNVEVYRTTDKLTVLVSTDDTPHGKLLHVSLSYPNKDPELGMSREMGDSIT